jgi:hypothetical protein
MRWPCRAAVKLEAVVMLGFLGWGLG